MRKNIAILEISLVLFLVFLCAWVFKKPENVTIAVIGLVILFLIAVFYKPTMYELGFSKTRWKQSLIEVSIALPLATMVWMYGYINSMIKHNSPLRWIGVVTLYLLLASIQQMIMFSFLYPRLEKIIDNTQHHPKVLGFLFGLAHFPNPILTFVCGFGGAVLARNFQKHRTIYPLIACQWLLGLTFSQVLHEYTFGNVIGRRCMVMILKATGLMA